MNAILNKSFLFLLFVSHFANLEAQNRIRVLGKTIDSAKQNIIGATICISQDNDSTLILSDESGNFQFSILEKKKFIIKVSALGYTSYYKEYNLSNEVNENINLTISLTNKFHTLKEVIIKGNPQSVVLKNDTLEYLVTNYNLRQNAVLNDFLKRLPGLTIEDNGDISYLGNKISKIKINGKEIAINNAKDLIANLSIEMIDKIQLIDDYGDFSQITGRRIELPSQMLNITTKNELKKINQIDLNLGLGNRKRQEILFNVARILPNQQLYLALNKYNTFLNESGDKTTTLAHIAFISTLNKVNIHTNLSHSDNTLFNEGTQFNQTTTSQGRQISNNKILSSGSNKITTLNFSTDYKSKSNHVLSSMINLELNNNNNDNSILSDQTGLQQLSQSIINKQNDKVKFINQSLLFSSPLNKKGRILTLSEHINYNSSAKIFNNNTSTIFYLTDTTTKDSIINQTLESKINSSNVFTQLSFIEPLTIRSNIEIGYNFYYLNSSNIIETYNNDILTQKTTLIDSLSENFNFITNRNEYHLNYKYSNSYITVIVGSKVTLYCLKSYPKFENSTLVRGYNISPEVNFQLKKKNSFFNATSSTILILPNYQQVQPIPNKIIFQYPIFGNPQLKAQTNYIFSSSYRYIGKFQLLINMSTQILTNKISTNVVLTKDSLNNIIQETHYINTNGNYRIGMNGGLYKQFRNNKYQISWDFKNSYESNKLYLDYFPSIVKTTSTSQTIKGSIFTKSIECTGTINYTYNKNDYLINKNSTISYTNLNLQLSTKLFFFKTFSIWVDLKKQLNYGLNNNLESNPLLLNAAIENSFFNNLISLKFQAINILDETPIVTQSISGNNISETKNNNIGKYFLLSLKLNLKKFQTKE